MTAPETLKHCATPAQRSRPWSRGAPAALGSSRALLRAATTTFLLLLLFVAAPLLRAQSTQPTSLPPPETWARVAAELPADITIDDVAALPDTAFAPYDAETAAADGARRDHPPVWLKLRLPSVPGTEAQPAILVIGRGYEDLVELYERDAAGNWQRSLAGESVPQAERAWPGLRNALPVRLPADGAEHVAFLRIVEPFAPEWTLTLEPDVAAFTAAQQRELVLFAAYFGGLGAIFAYNLFLYLRLRYRDLLYYLFYLATFCAVMAIETYASALFVPLAGPWREEGITALFNLSLAALLLFVREYHELPARMPRLARVVFGGALVFVVMATGFWLDSAHGVGMWFYRTNVILDGLALLGVPVISALAWRHGARQARFFLVAFGCYAFAMLVVIPNSVFLHVMSKQAEDVVALTGSALEFVLLSFAISDRFRRIRQEKDALQAGYTARLERDVAARTAELALANRQKDRLFAIIGHDIRGPLGAIALNSAVALRDVGSKFADLAGDIHASARQLLGLLDNLIDWSRLQTGDVSPRAEDFALADVVAEVVKLYEPVARHAGVSLVVDALPPALRLRADRPMFATILRNLTGNAVKVTPQGGSVRISVHAASPAAGERRHTLSVSDTGPGLSAEKIAALGLARGQPFTEAAAPRGLGLVVCREFAARLGGELWAESEPGRGTTLLFAWPADTNGV